MADLQIHGVGFNTGSFMNMSKAEFVSHPQHQNFWPELSEADRKDRLARSWHHITGKPEKKIPVENPSEDPLKEQPGIAPGLSSLK